MDKATRYLSVVTGLWLLAVGFGLFVLLQYSYRPGPVGTAPEVWPASTRLQFIDRKPNLIMFLHPKCPCSRASVREFEEIVARFHDLLHGQIVFVRPRDVSNEWVKTDLWDAATAIPDVAVLIDDRGGAAQFGALTSGHTLLFDAQRALVFSGGITLSRGHEGDNTGRDVIVAYLHANAGNNDAAPVFDSPVKETPIFGCPLLGSAVSSR